MKKIIKNLHTSAAVAVVLSACGGGGAGAPQIAAPAATPVSVPALPPTDLQASIPALNYVSTSAEFAFISSLNTLRSQVGLGLLAQNALLDQSARSHLQYVLSNDVLYGGTVDMRVTDPDTGLSTFHIENVANKGFTGVQASNRAAYFAYPGVYVGEELSFAGGKGGKVAFEGLASTVYHRAGLMLEGIRDVGVAAGQDASQTVDVEFGYAKPQVNAADFIGVYPADNQTAVGLNAGVETPNPFPDLSTSNADFPTKTGYPVSILAQAAAKLEVVTFTITEVGAAAPMPARLMTKDSDPNRLLRANVAFLVASSSMKPNTSYMVSFSGRVNNSVVTKNWKFTTRS
jgi:uncharacterized protein YkwD